LLSLDRLIPATMSLSRKSLNFSTSMKRKRVSMCLSMLTVHLEHSSVHSQLQVSNSDSKSPVSGVSMRTTHLNHLSHDSSGHKYGLVYPGVGWVVWRDEKELPAHLKFELHYLGGNLAVPDGAKFRCRGNLYPQLLSSWSSRRRPILQFHSSRLRRLRSSPTKESPKRKIHLHRHRSHWLYTTPPPSVTNTRLCLSLRYPQTSSQP